MRSTAIICTLVSFLCFLVHCQAAGNVTISIAVLDGTPASAELISTLIERFQAGALNLNYPVLAIDGDLLPEAVESASSILAPTSLIIGLVLSFRFGQVPKLMIFLAVMFMSLPSHGIGVYQNCKVLDGSSQLDFKISWNVTATHLHAAIEAKAMGWIATGISSDGSMPSAGNWSDLALGFINPAVAGCETGCIHDYHATTWGNPPLDPQQGITFRGASEINGVLTLEYSRLLNTGEVSYDRVINPAVPQHVLFAVQQDVKPESTTVFEKHNLKGSVPVTFNEPSSCPPPAAETVSLTLDVHPDTFDQEAFLLSMAGELSVSIDRFVVLDVQKNYPPFCPECDIFEFRVPDYAVPSDPTTYQCFGFDLPTTDHHIIRFEPIKDNELVLHHMVVFASETRVTGDFACSSMPPGTTPFYGWAPGGDYLDVPEGVGFPIGPTNGRNYAVIQMHYDNPTGSAIQRDSSGVRFYMKPYDPIGRVNAGFLFLGVGNEVINIPAGHEQWHMQGECTNGLSLIPVGQTVHIFATLVHMHGLGRRGWTDHIRNGQVIGKAADEENFDFSTQRFVPVDVSLIRDDSLVTHCIWDSTGATGPTVGGEDTDKEMCLTAVLYYPMVGATSCKETPSAGCDYPC